MDAKKHGVCLICGRRTRSLWKKIQRTAQNVWSPNMAKGSLEIIGSFCCFILFYLFIFFYESKLKIYYSVLEIRKITILVSKSKDNLLMNYLLLSLSVLKQGTKTYLCLKKKLSELGLCQEMSRPGKKLAINAARVHKALPQATSIRLCQEGIGWGFLERYCSTTQLPSGCRQGTCYGVCELGTLGG